MAERRRRRLAYLIAVIAALALLAGAAAWRGAAGLDQIALAATDPVESGRLAGAAQRLEAIAILRQVGRTLKAKSSSEQDLVERVVDWTHWNVRPQFASPEDIVADNLLGVLVRGRGYCDQDAAVAATILWTLGFEVRLLALVDSRGISPHTVMEVKTKDGWMVADPWSGAPYTREGRLHPVAALDADMLGYWGVTAFPPEDYRNGRRWRVFPFLTLNDLIERGKPKPASAPSPQVATDEAPPPPVRVDEAFRKAYVAARLADLRGEDARAAYTRLLAKAPDPSLAGALRYQIALEAAERGEAPPSGEGGWARSNAALAGQSEGLLNAGTLERLKSGAARSVLVQSGPRSSS